MTSLAKKSISVPQTLRSISPTAISSPERIRLTFSKLTMASKPSQTPQLLDFEWKFGVTASSSEMEKVANIFLRFKLSVGESNSDKTPVYMELSLPQFYRFLHEMEKAKSRLESN